jgi:hypothetical protein
MISGIPTAVVGPRIAGVVPAQSPSTVGTSPDTVSLSAVSAPQPSTSALPASGPPLVGVSDVAVAAAATLSPAAAVALQFSIHAEQQGGQTLWMDKTPIGPIKVVPKGTDSFHWGSPEGTYSLIAKGRIDADQLDSMLSYPMSRNEAQGPGFYVSLSPSDSSSFGSKLVITTSERDLSVIPSDDLYNARKNGLLRDASEESVNRALAAAGIHGRIQGDWLNLFHPDALSDIRKPTPDGVLTSIEEHAQGTSPEAQLQKLGDVATLADKGYGSAAPNDWTRVHAPLWDKLLRGLQPSAEDTEQLLSCAERQQGDVASPFFHFPLGSIAEKNVIQFFTAAQKSLAATQPADWAAVQQYQAALAAAAEASVHSHAEKAVDPHPGRGQFREYPTATGECSVVDGGALVLRAQPGAVK